MLRGGSIRRRQLAAAGRQVFIAAKDPGQADEAAAAMGSAVFALPVGLDVHDPASGTAAAQSLSASPGRLDVLVNNAAAYVDWTETAANADLDSTTR